MRSRIPTLSKHYTPSQGFFLKYTHHSAYSDSSKTLLSCFLIGENQRGSMIDRNHIWLLKITPSYLKLIIGKEDVTFGHEDNFRFISKCCRGKANLFNSNVVEEVYLTASTLSVKSLEKLRKFKKSHIWDINRINITPVTI